MKQVFRFKISIRVTSRCSVRQIVSISYYDHTSCLVDLRMQLRYFNQAKIHVVSSSIESEFVDDDWLEKESVYGF